MSFEGQPEVVPMRTHRVPQTIETPVTFAPVPGAYVRFAYSRSSDSMASQIEGQDYLCFKHNDQKLVFIVSDGVGSSFVGSLAARILGDNLLEWLWSRDIGYFGGEAALQEAAVSFLNRLQKQAQVEVEEYELPDMGSPLIQQALEGQRTYGSEAIFAACRIDHPGPMMPDGLISLFWMGDTRIHVLDREGEEIELGGTHDNANRWSTTKGVRGTMAAWMQPLAGVGRVVSYTDGLSGHAGALIHYPDDRLDREIRRGALLPTSDDVAFIDVVLRTPEYEGYPDPSLPDPNLDRPYLEQIWNPTGEKSYELRWRWTASGRPSYVIQQASSPALVDVKEFEVPHGQTSWKPAEPQEPGHKYYRIRAVRRFGGISPWSELRQTRVAHPAPPAPALTLEQTPGAAMLEWHAEGEMLEYVLERAATPDFAEPETAFEGRSTSWTVPTSKPGTYHFRVRAISDGGPGPWSEVEKVVVTMPPPATPSLAPIGYGFTYGELTLRWQQVPRAEYYELEERVIGGDDEPAIIRVEESELELEGKGVGQYVYRVRACHEFGCSEWSGEQMAVVSPRPPTDEPELTVEGPDENDLMRLSWTEVSRATEYLVEVSENETFDNARIYTISDLTLSLTRREPGLTIVRVCGTNEGGDGPWSNVERVAVAPPAPGWVEADLTGDGERVELAWGASGGRVTYRLEAASDPHDEDYEEVYAGAETQYGYRITDQTGPLHFRVRAELPGVHSAWVESEPVQVQAAPPAPRLGQPEIDPQGQVILRWGEIANADHYLVEVARNPSFADARGFEVKETGVNYRPPAPGSYWFRVRAASAGEGGTVLGELSEVQQVDVKQPAAPRLHAVDPRKAGQPFDITWQGVPNCTYYEIHEATDPGFTVGAVKKVQVFHPEQRLHVEGRPAGARYFRVRAVAGNEAPSAWSETLTVDVQP